MLLSVLFFLLLFVELLIAFSVFIYITSLLFSSFKGAPYVPTKQKSVTEILQSARLKKGARFLELGCGDGRVVKTAVEQFDTEGVGVDINPLLIAIAKARNKKNGKLKFQVADIFKTNLGSYDAIYVFLMPEMLSKLKNKFALECKKNALIISHGFKIEGWDSKIKNVLVRKPFPTYYYRV